ncbi:hypothetical protein [Staphylococcus shinii]
MSLLKTKIQNQAIKKVIAKISKSNPTKKLLVIEFPFDFSISKSMIWIGC